MIRPLFIVLVVLACFARVQSADRRTDASHLVIMTLNAEFLWDGVAPEEGGASFPWKNSQTEAEEHMAEIANLIIRANPDIVNLVEVEGLPALTRLNDGFLAGRGYMPYLVEGTDTATGQDVCLLTRIDPEGGRIERYNQAGEAGSVRKSVSKNYYAKFQINGQSIAVIGLHFLAEPNTPSRKLPREAQADAMRDLGVSLQSQGYALVVLGDFNDYDGAADSLDHQSSLPTTIVLSTIRGLDPARSDDNLVNVAAFISRANRYTAFWDQDNDNQIDTPQELTSIDHILLSPSLSAFLTYADIPHSHDPRTVTDHFPVVAQFTFGSPPPPPGMGVARITKLLPNPAGNENQNEKVWIKNMGTANVNLVGWRLRDRAHTEWKLDELGSIAPNEEKAIQRNGKPMALNNGGDTVDLLDASGGVVQTVDYGSVDELEEVEV
jgi:exonuclease III